MSADHTGPSAAPVPTTAAVAALVSVSSTRTVPLMVGTPVARVFWTDSSIRTQPVPLTVISTPSDSISPPVVQMAPWAVQSVVASRAIVTSESDSGSTVISQPRLLPGSNLLAPVTVPSVTENAWSLSVRKPTETSSLNRSSKVKEFCPSWDAGA